MWVNLRVAQVRSTPRTPTDTPCAGVIKEGAVPEGSKLRHYYTINGRLYYVTGVSIAKDVYEVENCETGLRMRVDSEYLKEVKWIDARSRSS